MNLKQTILAILCIGAICLMAPSQTNLTEVYSLYVNTTFQLGTSTASSLGAALSAAPNGTMVYCSDCMNVVDDSITAGTACLGGGHGAMAHRKNSHWTCE
jgi:hypothetical protein